MSKIALAGNGDRVDLHLNDNQLPNNGGGLYEVTNMFGGSVKIDRNVDNFQIAPSAMWRISIATATSSSKTASAVPSTNLFHNSIESRFRLSTTPVLADESAVVVG